MVLVDWFMNGPLAVSVNGLYCKTGVKGQSLLRSNSINPINGLFIFYMKRSNEQKEAHQQHAKRLLDLGFRKADISATLQRKYSLSRATAYRDVDEADQSREIEDLTIEADACPMISLEDRDALMRMTRQLIIDSYSDGNVQDFSRLVREYERLARMGGLSQKF